MARCAPIAPIVLALLMAGSPAFATVARDAGGDHHAHHALDPVADGAPPAAAERWTPDAPLREGMRRIRDALKGVPQPGSGPLAEQQGRELATAVDEAVAFMFANCKLDPVPDHALHAILARLMAGAQALHEDPANASPVTAMRAALEDYPRQFDDPSLLATGIAKP